MNKCGVSNPIKPIWGKILLAHIIVALLSSSCSSTSRPDHVEGTWRFDTIFQPRTIKPAGQHWLAIDAKGYPHLAYGGDQLYYAWFDGTAWHNEIADSSPGAGQYAQLLLDANDLPHIVHRYRGGSRFDQDLIYTYKDLNGWHGEMIDADICDTDHLDVQFDHQQVLSIVYDDAGVVDAGRDDCHESSIDAGRIYYGQRKTDGWEIQLVAHPGLGPSLAFDETGQPHISYTDTTFGKLNEVYLTGERWVARSYRGSDFIHLRIRTALVISSDMRSDIYYTTGISPGYLNHAWWDGSDWQNTELLSVSDGGVRFSAIADTQGRNIVFCDGKIIQSDTNGQIVTSTLTNESMESPSLAFDQKGGLHLAYWDLAENAIVYAVQEDAGWRTTVVDNRVFSFIHETVLAFDQTGSLHAVARVDQSLYYFSMDGESWQHEFLGTTNYRLLGQPLALLFDLDNQPHVFYWMENRTLTLVHVFKGLNGWTSEYVPFGDEDTAPHFSYPAISPEGWPVIFITIDNRWQLLYRSPDGWHLHERIGDDINHWSSELAIAYPQGQSPATDGSVSVPYILFNHSRSQEIRLRYPGEEIDVTIGKVEPDPSGIFLSLQFKTPDTLEAIVFSYRSQSIWVYSLVPAQRQAMPNQARWVVPTGNYSYTFPTHVIDEKGNLHLVYGDNTNDTLYYLFQDQQEWKVSEIGGEGMPSQNFSISSAALSPTGQFCALVTSSPSNDIVIACLENAW